MPKTIGNPLSWGAEAVSGTGHHLAEATGHIGSGRSTAAPVVKTLHLEDIRHALRDGAADFAALRSDVIFMVALYPIIGLCLAVLAFHANFAPFIFPLVAGFALVGPVSAIGLYELSRQREQGLHPTWSDAFALLRSPALAPIIVLGLALFAIFVIWMIAANLIYGATLGTAPQPSFMAFVREVLTTPQGWQMIVIGNLVGLAFAALVLAISVVSFPLLLDRDVGVPQAVVTSVEVTRKNPRVIGTWGLIVAVLLVIGSIPLLLGLIFVMPILGHATWHLYRRAIG